MIYIVTALYCEAHILIEYFSLKKVVENTRFQQFASEDGRILLIVSGAGEIAAASAVSSICTKALPGREDVLINIGACAAPVGQEGVFLIHKLTEQATGKTFYPDLLYRHGFQEAELVTGMLPWKQRADCRGSSGKGVPILTEPEEVSRRCVYDMEAAGVYQAGAYFFSPHQMQFLKVVSDHGEEDRLSGKAVQQLMEAYREDICIYVEQLLQIAQKVCAPKKPMQAISQDSQNRNPEQWVRQICMDLHASKAMGDGVRQYVRYAELAGIDWRAAVNGLYGEQRLPCRNKREGKACFEELKQRLLSAVSFTYLCGEAGAESSADENAPGKISGSKSH